jgi:CrcB protein
VTARIDPREVAAIFVGGFAGAVARAELAEALPYRVGQWPWATFLVNVVGAFLLGYFATRLQERLPVSAYRRPLLGTGLCGALTTFSTMQLELLSMLDTNRVGTAARMRWSAWRRGSWPWRSRPPWCAGLGGLDEPGRRARRGRCGRLRRARALRTGHRGCPARRTRVPVRDAGRERTRRLRAGDLRRRDLGKDPYELAGVGFVGAFTTFSTWAFESHRLGEDGVLSAGVVNFVVSLFLGIVALWAGRHLGASW